MNDVTVEGNDSMFMFHGKMTTFATIDSTNIRVQNLSFDFRTPTVVDVTVESTDGNTAVMYVPECYDYSVNGTTVTWMSDVSPYTGERYWTTTNSMNYKQVFDIKTGRTYRGDTNLFQNVTAIQDIGNHRLKFTYSSRPSDIVAGKCHQMRPTVRDHAGMFFWKSDGVMFKNINAYFLHGFGIVGQSSGNITLDHVILETPEGSGRTTAGYADFIQMSGCKDEIKIRDCVFSNPHDDPINVHGTFNEVIEKNPGGVPNTVLVQYRHGETAGFPNFFVGDTVRFLKKSNATPVKENGEEWQATVVAVDGPDGEGGRHSEYQDGLIGLRNITLTLSEAIPAEVANAQPGYDEIKDDDGNLLGTEPAMIEGVRRYDGSYVIENLTYRPKVLIENCVFKETPTRGILMKAGGGKAIIRNNIFDNMGMNSIQIEAMMGWYESGPVENVTIEGNTFISSSNPVIKVDPDGSGDTRTPVHKNITIKNNTFYMQNGNALNIKNTKGVTVSNNKIYRANPDIKVELNAPAKTYKVNDIALWHGASIASSGTELNSNLYSFDGCTDVKIEGNTYGGGLKPHVALSGGMNSSHVTIKDDAAGTSDVNVLPRAGAVRYESDTEDVLTITPLGHLTALHEGTAKVRAYTVVGGRKFVSDWETITVTNDDVTAGSALRITNTAGENGSILRVTNDYTKTIQYSVVDNSASSENEAVTWKVENVEGAGSASGDVCARIDQNGVLTPVKDGVVRVIAEKEKGTKKAREILVLNKGKKELNEALEIYTEKNNSNYGEKKSDWTITQEGNITIKGNGNKGSGTGIYQTQTLQNMFVTTNEYSKEGLEVSVKLTGKLIDQWNEAGLWIGKDADNYVGISRKHRGGNDGKKISMANENEHQNIGESWLTADCANGEADGQETV